MPTERPPQSYSFGYADHTSNADGVFPHVNFGPWFRTQLPLVSMLIYARGVAETIRPFDVVGVSEEQLGLQGLTRSIRLDPAVELQRLHDFVDRWLVSRAHGRYFNPDHAGEGYIPHLTPRGKLAEFAVGSQLHIDSVSLITGDPKNMKLVRSYALGQSHGRSVLQ